MHDRRSFPKSCVKGTHAVHIYVPFESYCDILDYHINTEKHYQMRISHLQDSLKYVTRYRRLMKISEDELSLNITEYG